MRSKRKNKHSDKIIGTSVGLAVGVIILYFIYGGPNSVPSTNLQPVIVPTTIPIQNNDDLIQVSEELENSDLEFIDNELLILNSDSTF